MISLYSIIGVGAAGDVSDGAEAGGVFLENRPGERLAVGVLREPHSCGRGWIGGSVEANGYVFPVSDVVAQFEVGVFEKEVALVKGPEGEVEDISDVGGFGNDDDGGGYGARGCAIGGRLDASEPRGSLISANALVGVKIDILTVITVAVEDVEVVKSQLGRVCDGILVNSRVCVGELGSDVAGKELFVGVKPEERCMIECKLWNVADWILSSVR